MNATGVFNDTRSELFSFVAVYFHEFDELSYCLILVTIELYLSGFFIIIFCG